MTVSEIKDIAKKESKVYYLENFTGTAVYSILDKEVLGKVEFSIEHKPTGEREIKVSIIDKPDYPVLQIKMDLKKHIESLYQENLLP